MKPTNLWEHNLIFNIYMNMFPTLHGLNLSSLFIILLFILFICFLPH